MCSLYTVTESIGISGEITICFALLAEVVAMIAVIKQYKCLLIVYNLFAFCIIIAVIIQFDLIYAIIGASVLGLNVCLTYIMVDRKAMYTSISSPSREYEKSLIL